MASKPETTFIAAVHRHLPSTVYRMKNNNPFIGGIPDVWYSAKRDLWVEYKFLPRVPQRGVVSPVKLLSPLQVAWLNGRHEEGRAVKVVIGCPAGGIILHSPTEWQSEISAKEFISKLQDRKTIADWILQTTR